MPEEVVTSKEDLPERDEIQERGQDPAQLHTPKDRRRRLEMMARTLAAVTALIQFATTTMAAIHH